MTWRRLRRSVVSVTVRNTDLKLCLISVDSFSVCSRFCLCVVSREVDRVDSMPKFADTVPW